jgi:threonine synthase
MKNEKYHLECKKCGEKIPSFAEWFDAGQKCPKCGFGQADVWYERDFKELIAQIKDKNFNPRSLWAYFDFLPVLDPQNIVSVGGEGVVPIDNWTFLEKFAKEKYNLDIKVYAHRNDDNYSTGTFKDLAGTMVASLLKEHKKDKYVVASTGNIGVAFSRYCAAANVSLSAFIPAISLKSQEAEIGCFGQTVYRVNGDYHRAKHVAAEFAKKNDILLAAGNFDPMRIEAKKTMVYEWIRQMPQLPTVYMQALSGGSGPIGIEKACRELKGTGAFDKMPRFILVQPSKCAPMAHAWDKAKAQGFPQGWQNEYPVYEDPETKIQTLSTGNPTAYPYLAPMVKDSQGEIIDFEEIQTLDVARLAAFEVAVRIGPAAAVTLGGFIKSLRLGHIKNGDVVMINIGEGIRRAPGFMEEISYSAKNVDTVEQCEVVDRKVYGKKLWEAIEKI